MQQQRTIQRLSPRSDAVRTPALVAVSPRPRIRTLKGASAILEAEPLLTELARQTSQSGEMDSLKHFLSTPDAVRKTPYLLLIERGGGTMRRAAVRAEDLLGAVMLFEYRAGPANLRVFSTADTTGRRSVLAAPQDRAAVAALAAKSLVEGGGQVVHVVFCETHRDRGGDTIACSACEAASGAAVPAAGSAGEEIRRQLRSGLRRPQAEWALLEREIPAYLQLLPTFDATLAHIGQRTRSNLRYYRRRSELDLGCRFVEDVEIGLDEFLAYNRECTYAVSDELAARRYTAWQAMPHAPIRGVRDREGRWLSLVGIRRQHTYAEIDWQMNRAGLPHYSLATVMRSYLIEHEIRQGKTRLYIEGGTPQPIGKSFLKERVGELTVRRRSPYVWALKRFADKIFPAKNYIRQTLQDPELEWRSW